MTKREEEILNIIQKNPFISQEELAYILGISRAGVASHIHNLLNKGYIIGKGYVLSDRQFVSVIGGVNIDIMGISNNPVVLDNSNPGKIAHTLGGAGWNIALTLAKLNVGNHFITVYGDDIHGKNFLDVSKKNEINTQCCELIPKENTSTYTYIVDSNGDRVVGVDDMEIYDRVTPEFIEKYLTKINNSQICVFDTNIPEKTIQFLYDKVKVPLIVKTVSQNKNMRLLKGIENIDFLITTSREIFQILEPLKKKFTKVDQAVNYLYECGVKNILLFTVQDGLYFKSKTESFTIQNKFKIKNATGANACLTGALIWGLKNHLPLKTSLKYAYAAAINSAESEEVINPNLSAHYLGDIYTTIFGES